MLSLEKLMMETGQSDFPHLPSHLPRKSQLQQPHCCSSSSLQSLQSRGVQKIPAHKSLYSTIYKQDLEDKMLTLPDYSWIYWHQLSKALHWCPVEIVKPLPSVKTLSWTRSLSSHKLHLIWNNWAQKPSSLFPILIHLLHWNCYQIYFKVGMGIHL